MGILDQRRKTTSELFMLPKDLIDIGDSKAKKKYSSFSQSREGKYFLGSYLKWISTLMLILFPYAASAQIEPDNSLGGEDSTVLYGGTINNNLVDLIEGGAIRGNNLFHSFEQFNIPEGSSVYFANPDAISSILTRITGNSASEILGTLGVDGNANLFLLNPNGILFGENAALDINGSFLATTANSFIFANNFVYSASNPTTPPLLTINIPVGIQFATRAEPVINQSFILNELDEYVGLEVPPGENITLIGGDILLEGGIVTAPNGSIEIGSVAPNSLINIQQTANNWILDYGDVLGFQDVILTAFAGINSSGDGAGKIQIEANRLDVLDGSTIFADNYGEQNGGILDINARESVLVKGADVEGNVALITADTYGEGKGSDFIIDTENLLIQDGAQIAAGTWGIGDSGDLIINATKLEVVGTSPDEIPSGIFTDVADAEATGKGGNLNITTQELNVSNGAWISAGTFGSGDSGNIEITAQEIQVLNGASITADTLGSGDAGDLLISVERLNLGDGLSQIAAGTWGSGNSGDLIIRATNSISISGTGLDIDLAEEGELNIFSSGLFASVELGATGNGGNLIIDTGNLSLANGAKIVANTLGEGNAGDISIRANNIEVKGTVVDLSGTRSGISTAVEPGGIGNGGDLEIIANNLSLIDGGAIAVDARGQGDAGNINLKAQNINISGVSSSEPVHGIRQQSLPSEISAFSLGEYDAGLITINAQNLNLNNRGDISVSNLGSGNAGNINITANEIKLSNSATIEADVNVGTQGNIGLTTNNITLRNNSEITARASEMASGGNIVINNKDNITLFDGSRIIADSLAGDGGNISISTQGLFSDRDSSISASSVFGLDGNVEIQSINGDRYLDLAELPENPLDASQKLTSGCEIINDFTIVGKGGLPENPTQSLTTKTLWQDLRLVNLEFTEPVTRKLPIFDHSTLQKITEAKVLQLDSQGNLILVAKEHYSLPNYFDCYESG